MTISIRKYKRAVKVIDDILQEYSFKFIKLKRNEYQRKKDPSLKHFNSIYIKFTRNNKIIQEYKTQQLSIRHICNNCHCEQQQQHNNNAFYKLQFIQQEQNNIKT